MPGTRTPRRTFLKQLAAGSCAVAIFPSGLIGRCTTSQTRRSEDPWAAVPEILSRIRPPVFPDREFLITDFGATADGSTDATEAIRAAVGACARSGGGRVIVPEGNFLTGPVHLQTNVNLHVADSATLRFTEDTRRYLPAVFTRWEGMELMNYSPLIYAFGAENVAVTGTGTLDGSASRTRWWPWKGREEYGWSEGTPDQTAARDRLQQLVADSVPVESRIFGEGGYLRPSFVQPYRCRNVLIEGVTIVNSPMWEVHPVLCTNVTVRGVRVKSHGPNNDGCNPESCRDVLIENCYFDTGDDCIALKSGRNADGRRLAVPVENVIIRNCTMKDGHGGVVIGSEVSGGARNIFASDCLMSSPNLERAFRIKTNSVRGGFVENVYVRNLTVGQVSDAVVRINFQYEEGDAGPYDPVVRDIEVQNVSCNRSRYALYLIGYEDNPIRGLRLTDCDFRNVEKDSVIENVEDLILQNVTVNGKHIG